MTIDPAVLIGFIGAILALLGLVFRMFVNGDLLSKNSVPRADYERVIAINEGYAAKFGEQTTAIGGLASTIEKAVAELVSSRVRSDGKS